MWITPSGRNVPSPDTRIPDIQKRPDDFKIIERVPLKPEPIRLGEPKPDDISMVILDTETTGFDPTDAIIELGMVRCQFSAQTGQLTSIDAVFDEFDDPQRPIPDEVTAITGIADHMVANKRIDERMVSGWLGSDPLIVAHNAAFDRPFFERRFGRLDGYRWVCSLVDIPWKVMGYEYKGLAALLAQEGWFYDGHRAHTDCLALIWLLGSAPGALDCLVQAAANTYVKMCAGRNTYDIKDHLKKRGYRWDSVQRIWWRTISESNLNAEMAYLRKLHPIGQYIAKPGGDARTRFKSGL